MSELHYLTLELCRMAKRYQTKALGLNTALTVLLQRKEVPTKSQMQQATADGETFARSQANPEFDELEKALLDGSDFLPFLRAYLDKHK